MLDVPGQGPRTPIYLIIHEEELVTEPQPVQERVGRPGLMKSIRELIVRMATDNSSWGYLRIQGEMKKVEHRVARTTIAKTLKDRGIAPSPDRPTSWRRSSRRGSQEPTSSPSTCGLHAAWSPTTCCS